MFSNTWPPDPIRIKLRTHTPVFADIPDADSASVNRMAERLRLKVENAGFAFADHVIPVTVSLGVALRSDSGADTVEKMVSAADKALYHAKKSGRNRVALLSGEDARLLEFSAC